MHVISVSPTPVLHFHLPVSTAPPLAPTRFTSLPYFVTGSGFDSLSGEAGGGFVAGALCE